MAVKGSKNTEQRETKTKAGMMGTSTEKNSDKDSKSEKLENIPKTSKEKSTESDSDKPLH